MGLLNKKIYSVSGDAFGLDLSDLSVKAVQIEGGNGLDSVSSFGSVSLPAGSVVDGEIKESTAVVQAIKKLLLSTKPKRIKTRKVVCSLPETKAFLRVVSIPRMDAAEAHEAVKWEMEANIPLPLDQVYYDWQILDHNLSAERGKMDLLVVAMSKNTVDQIVDTLEEAGLEPVGLEIESVAQARSILSEQIGNRTVLIVDIGDRRTSFSISNCGVPCFTSSIPLSGALLTDAISKGMGISAEEAEKIKLHSGIGSDFKNDMLFKSVRPVLENLAMEMERSMDFYLSGLRYSANIERIILCGGGANTKGIVPYLSKRMGKEIELGNPWVNINLGKNTPPISKEYAAQYSTAIGLALRGLYYENIS